MTVESDADQVTAGKGPAGSVDVSRTVEQPVGVIWQGLTSPQGAAVWLGEGAVVGSKGDSYRCADGTWGVVRSFHPLEQLRVSWHANDGAPATLIEVDLTPDGDGTGLRLTQSGPLEHPGADELHRRWTERLDALARYADGIG